MNDEIPAEETIEVPSRPLTEREKYYWEQGFKEPVDSIARIEDTAKFIAGAVTASSGLLLSALKITAAGDAAMDMKPWWLVIGVWLISMLMLFGVLFPLPWYTRSDNPAEMEETYRQIRNTKYALLIFGTLLFFAGMLAGLNALHPTS